MKRRSVIRGLGFALPFALAVGGCDHRIPFSPDLFEKAKRQCGAQDAYILPDHPKAITFHGASADHEKQAKCLKDKLRETDMEQVILVSSHMYVTP
jgi:hypothetical protein